MRLTKEQLLFPRYRVIADYPISPYKIGDIITFKHNDAKVVETDHTIIYFEKETFKKYPHLFAPVHWSDNRLEGDFPEYVLFNKTCVPAKVLSLRCDEAGLVTEVETDAEPGEYYRADIWDFPATQHEYEQSNKQS